MKPTPRHIALVGASILLLAGIVSAREPGTRTIYVSVLASNGAPSGLNATDFVIKEDGKPREVVDARVAAAPVQVVFMLDDSGLGLGSIRQGAWEFVRALGGNGQFAIMAIGSQNLSLLEFTSEPQAIHGGLSRLLTRSSPPTAVLDGLLEAARSLKRREAQRPIIVLVATEGADFSHARPETVLETIQSSRAQVYYLGLGTPVTQGVRPALNADRAHDSTEDEALKRNVVLSAAPKDSGGRSEQVYQTSGLPTLMRNIGAEIAAQYAVTYRTELDRARLSVETRRKGLKLRAPLRVSSR
jgi:VWFA-related protein